MPGSSIPRLRFHAVSVVTNSHACPAARALKDVRLLSSDAPRLPLANCDNPELCACKFQHHDDRRAGPRRQTEIRQAAGRQFRSHERRDRPGRRDSDFPEDR
ncbi:MAG TPA: hypothetical protein VF851_06080 [Steroidobacteraceae bacterium]